MRACKDLREIPGVRNCGSHIGQALEGDEVYGPYFGENWISVDKNVDYDDTLAAAIHRTVEGYPGLYRDVQTYLRERIKEVLSGTASRSWCGPTGLAQDAGRSPRRSQRRSRASRASPTCRPASRRTPAHPGGGQPRQGTQYDLKLGDVRRQSSTLLASEEVSDLFHGGKAYDVHVFSIPSARNSLTDVENLPIDTPDGGRVRLEQVADIKVAPTPNNIERENQSRRIDGARTSRRATPWPRSSSRSRIAWRASSSPRPTTPRCWASRPSSTPHRTA